MSAGFHDEAMRAVVLEVMPSLASVHSLNEDEARHYLGRQVDLTDPQEVATNFEEPEADFQAEEANETDDGKETSPAEEDLQHQFIRLQADFANYKRRMERDRESLSMMALEKFVNQLLPIMDNFERALSSFRESDEKLYSLDRKSVV